LKKLFAVIILIIVMADCFLTLIGQPPLYWKNYSNCDESSIVGQALLRLHPLAFVLGLIFWAILITFLINKLTPLFSHILFFALFIGHSLGAWSWIQPYLKSVVEILIGKKFNYSQKTLYGEISDYLFYVFLALILALALKKVRKRIR